jgi:hypothetical protein
MNAKTKRVVLAAPGGTIVCSFNRNITHEISKREFPLVEIEDSLPKGCIRAALIRYNDDKLEHCSIIYSTITRKITCENQDNLPKCRAIFVWCQNGRLRSLPVKYSAKTHKVTFESAEE